MTSLRTTSNLQFDQTSPRVRRGAGVYVADPGAETWRGCPGDHGPPVIPGDALSLAQHDRLADAPRALARAGILLDAVLEFVQRPSRRREAKRARAGRSIGAMTGEDTILTTQAVHRRDPR